MLAKRLICQKICSRVLFLRLLACLAGLAVMGAVCALIGFLIMKGGHAVNVALFFGDADPWKVMMGRVPVWDALWPACVGTLYLLLLTMAIALLPGLGGGIYLARHASPCMQSILGFSLDLLAGIPSIVMGLFGFTLLLTVRKVIEQAGLDWQVGPSLLLSSICLSLLVLPVIVVTTRNSIQSLPQQLAITGASMGLDDWQVTRRILLPAASRGILGGVLLSTGRIAEDTAVIMLTGAVANAGLPSGLGMRYEALPFTIFYRASQYHDANELAQGFATALVLLALSMALLAGASAFQVTLERRWRKG